MSNFEYYTLENAPEASKPLLDNSVKGFGMIPNLHAVMAESPALLETPLASEKLEALRTTTLLMAQNRGVIDQADIEAFYAAGFTKQNLLDIVLVLAQKVMSNYTNHLAETTVDEPFQAFAWEK